MKADAIQRYITIDTSDQDLDTIQVRGANGESETLLFPELYRLMSNGDVILPDGTVVDDKEELQLAFQNALIEATGMCVLELDYHRAGYPNLAKLVRSARGASSHDS